jgi:hypothetical protein
MSDANVVRRGVDLDKPAIVQALEDTAAHLALLEVALSDYHEANEGFVHAELQEYLKALSEVERHSGSRREAIVPRELLRQLDGANRPSNPDMLLKDKLALCAAGVDECNRRHEQVQQFDAAIAGGGEGKSS